MDDVWIEEIIIRENGGVIEVVSELVGFKPERNLKVGVLMHIEVRRVPVNLYGLSFTGGLEDARDDAHGVDSVLLDGEVDSVVDSGGEIAALDEPPRAGDSRDGVVGEVHQDVVQVVAVDVSTPPREDWIELIPKINKLEVGVLGGGWEELSVHAGVLDGEVLLVTLDVSDPLVDGVGWERHVVEEVQGGPLGWVVKVVEGVDHGYLEEGLVVVQIDKGPELGARDLGNVAGGDAKWGGGVVTVDHWDVVLLLKGNLEVANAELESRSAVHFRNNDELAVLPEVVLDVVEFVCGSGVESVLG